MTPVAYEGLIGSDSNFYGLIWMYEMVGFIGTRICLTSFDHAVRKEQQTRRKYDADFKAKLLKRLASGQILAYIANVLGIFENIIYR